MSKSTAETMEECVRTVDLAANDKYRLLADEHRRLALALLAQRRDTVDVEDLAAEVARREAGGEPVGEQVVDRVMVSLHHRHLPMMDNLGVVDYDADLCLVDPDGIPRVVQDGRLEWER